MTHTLLVTGGAGFIGSNFVHAALARPDEPRVVVLDALTYAGNPDNLADLDRNPRYAFVHGDVAEPADVQRAMEAAGTGALTIVHFAAETHVDRSIVDARPFVRSNVLGTQVLIDAARARRVRRFVQVSTDEVYGPLEDGHLADETAPLHPSSAYAASKASGDLLALAAFRTHALPAVVVRCSNNFGPFQFPEKLIPLVIANAREDRRVPIYGDGLQRRDWIHVADACAAISLVSEKGEPGTIYNVAGGSELPNLELVRRILRALGRRDGLIEHVRDRPGHDRRYGIDATRIRSELGWSPRRDFDTALQETIDWYAAHAAWLERVRSGAYRDWYRRWYGKALP